jgi:hypothetical protein
MTPQLPIDDNDSCDSGEDSKKQIVEDMLSYIKALLRKIGLQVVEPSRDETAQQSERTLRSERRRERRRSRISPCAYGVLRSADRDGAILEEGHGTAVNDSPTGMRLLLGVAPSKGQLLEIQTNDRTLERSICLVEVCWTKSLEEDTREPLYLVGCRQTSGATHK